MEVKTTEEVTRIYCDVCNKDITNDSRYGGGTDKPDQKWVTCSGGEYILNEGHSRTLIPDSAIFGDYKFFRRPVFSDPVFGPKAILNCADIALLKFKYPELLTTG